MISTRAITNALDDYGWPCSRMGLPNISEYHIGFMREFRAMSFERLVQEALEDEDE